jgi:hypothetical protein
MSFKIVALSSAVEGYDATLFQRFFDLYSRIKGPGNESCLSSCFFHILEGQDVFIPEISQQVSESQSLYVKRFKDNTERKHTKLMPSPILKSFNYSEVRKKRLILHSPSKRLPHDEKMMLKIRVEKSFEQIKDSADYRRLVNNVNCPETMLVMYGDAVSHAITLGWKMGHLSIFDPAIGETVSFGPKKEFESWIKFILLYRHLKSGKPHSVQFVTYSDIVPPKVKGKGLWDRFLRGIGFSNKRTAVQPTSTTSVPRSSSTLKRRHSF